jgi:hypothetical protein
MLRPRATRALIEFEREGKVECPLPEDLPGRQASRGVETHRLHVAPEASEQPGARVRAATDELGRFFDRADTDVDGDVLDRDGERHEAARVVLPTVELAGNTGAAGFERQRRGDEFTELTLHVATSSPS